MILLLGSSGFLGKRVVKFLNKKNIIFKEIKGKSDLDLRNFFEVDNFFRKIKPEVIINCSANVGGIQYGYKYPADIFFDNTQIQINILKSSVRSKVKRLINPIPNCSYPHKLKLFKESNIWDGEMHESVRTYGFVKKGYLISSWAYKKQFNLELINLIFSNLYGPEDHFDEERSHALGAIVMKISKANRPDHSSVKLFGTGNPVREWLHVDDAANSLIRALDIKYIEAPLNIGIGKGLSINELANLIKNYIGYNGDIVFDKTKPDGDNHKTMDGSLAKKIMNWSPEIEFKRGLEDTIKWYESNFK